MTNNKRFLGADLGKTKKTIRRTIVITERMNEMAEEIAKHKGLTTFTAVVENGISLLHSKTIDYKVLKTTNPSTGLSPTELARVKVQKKKDEEQAEKDLKEEEKIRACEDLMLGEVEVDGPYKYCKFKVHSRFESKQSKVPLSQAGPEVARSVFIPDMTTVFDKRPELAEEMGYKYVAAKKAYVPKQKA